MGGLVLSPDTWGKMGWGGAGWRGGDPPSSSCPVENCDPPKCCPMCSPPGDLPPLCALGSACGSGTLPQGRATLRDPGPPPCPQQGVDTQAVTVPSSWPGRLPPKIHPRVKTVKWVSEMTPLSCGVDRKTDPLKLRKPHKAAEGCSVPSGSPHFLLGALQSKWGGARQHPKPARH